MSSSDALLDAPDGTPAPVAEAAAADPDKPTPEEQAEAQRRHRLHVLMMKIDENPDFASTKQSVVGMQQVSRSERAHARALVNLIHDDAAMAGKLLRMVNAAFYSAVGGGQITNLQRAVALMGFSGIGMLATSLMMFERLPKGADGDRLRREFARAQLAAILAHDFCNDRQYLDSVYIAALFQRLGEFLAGLHLREEMQVIEDQLDDRELAAFSPERAEARRLLVREQWGVSLEDLALEVAGRWGWPNKMQLAMRPLPVTDPEAEVSGDEYFRMLCTAANGLADVMMRHKPVGTPEEQAEARKALAGPFVLHHGQVLGLNPETVPDQLEKAREMWLDLLNSLGVSLADGSTTDRASQEKKKVVNTNSQAYRQELAMGLADAVERLTRLNHKGAPLAEVFETTLRLLRDTMDLQRAVVCLREPNGAALKGHLGIGDRAVVLTPYFHVPLNPPSDVFGLLCTKNADTLISDTHDPVVANRLPEWFHKKVKAGSFLLLPLVQDGVVLGMLYGDQPDPKQLVIHERGLTLLKDLRKQVLRAMQPKPAKA